MIVGNIIDFMAFGLAPASLLAPLAALSLVWNLGVSSHVLHEEYDRNDVMAVLLIFIGTGITVLYSSHEEQAYSLDDLMTLYTEPRMKWYYILCPFLLGSHYYATVVGEKYRLEGSMWKLVDLVGWAGFAGMTGGQSILFAKSTVELIKDAAHGQDVFWHIQTYLIIVMLVICLLTQITFLNGAMKRYDQLYVMPIYQSYWIIFSEISGLVYFGEWETLSPKQVRFFILGTIITLAGLFQLTKKENHNLQSTGPQPDFDVISVRSRPPSLGIAEDFSDDEALFGIEMGSLSSPRGTSPRDSPSGRLRRSTSSMDSDDPPPRKRSSMSSVVQT